MRPELPPLRLLLLQHRELLTHVFMSVLYSLVTFAPITAIQGVPGAGKTFLQALTGLMLVGVAHEPVLMLAS